MRAVDVGIRHDDHFAVSNLSRIKIFAADAGAQCRDNRTNFFIGKNFIQPRFFDIENFSLDRQNCLKPAVTALFRGAAGGVALNDVNFTMLRIGDTAIRELTGKAGAVDTGFAPRQFFGFAGGLTRARGEQTFFDDLAADRRIFFKIRAQTVVTNGFDDAAHFAVAELGFGLAFKLRLGNFDAQHRGQTFAHIIAGKLDIIFLFDEIIFRRVGIDRLGQRRFETDEMRAAFDGVNVIDIGKNIVIVSIVILQRQFHRHILTLTGNINRFFHQGFARFIDILHEFADTALVLKFFFLAGALVEDINLEFFVKKRQLPQPFDQGIKIKFLLAENFVVGKERDFGAGAFAFANGFDIVHRRATGVFLHVDVAVAGNFHHHPFRKRIDDGNADAVQTAGHFVRFFVKLAAGVQLGHHHFERRPFDDGMEINRNAAPVIFNGDAAIFVDGHLDFITKTDEGLVNGVINDFVDEMMKAARGNIADIHRRPFAHRIETFENGNRTSVILLDRFLLRDGRVAIRRSFLLLAVFRDSLAANFFLDFYHRFILLCINFWR
ncbi:MAG: hypothetical protein ALAOOOJD_00590 [bacterium]|nr:hypothetical protein [bacterium]